MIERDIIELTESVQMIANNQEIIKNIIEREFGKSIEELQKDSSEINEEESSSGSPKRTKPKIKEE